MTIANLTVSLHETRPTHSESTVTNDGEPRHLGDARLAPSRRFCETRRRPSLPRQRLRPTLIVRRPARCCSALAGRLRRWRPSRSTSAQRRGRRRRAPPTPPPAASRARIRSSSGDPAEGVDLEVDGPAASTRRSRPTTTASWGQRGHRRRRRTRSRSTTDSLPDGAVPRPTPKHGRPQGRTSTSAPTSAAIFQLAGPTRRRHRRRRHRPSTFSWDRFAQQFASGIRLGLLLALAAIGLSLIYGTTGLRTSRTASR